MTDVVAIVRSKSGQSVDVELGVFDPLPYVQLWRRLPKTITEADCVVRIPLDTLADTRRIWHEDSQEDAVVLAHLLKSEGLGWLEALHDAQARVSHLRQRPWLIPTEAALLALTEAEMGDRSAARSRLQSLVLGPDDEWSIRIGSLLSSLNGS